MKSRIQIIGVGGYGAYIANKMGPFSGSNCIGVDSDYSNLNRLKNLKQKVLLGGGKGALGTLASYDYGLAVTVHFCKKLEEIVQGKRNIIVSGFGGTGWGVTRFLMRSEALKKSVFVLQMPFYFEGMKRMFKAEDNIRLAEYMKVRTVVLNEDKVMKYYRGRKGMDKINLFKRARQEMIEKVLEVYAHENKCIR